MQDSKTISGSPSADGLWSEYRHWVIGAIVLVVSILIWQAQGGETVFPESWISAFPFADKVNEFDRWMRPFLQPTTRALGAGVTWFYEYIDRVAYFEFLNCTHFEFRVIDFVNSYTHLAALIHQIFVWKPSFL